MRREAPRDSQAKSQPLASVTFFVLKLLKVFEMAVLSLLGIPTPVSKTLIVTRIWYTALFYQDVLSPHSK
jgi:hypothetical protein